MKRLVSVLWGVSIFLGAIRAYILYRDSFPTPTDALNDYIARITIKNHSPQKIESLHVVSATPSHSEDNEQLLLFQAYDRGLQTHIAGYTTLQNSLFGWHVEKFQMTGKSPLPEDILAGFDWSEGGPIVYGQVFLAEADRIEAVFSDPNQGEVTIRVDLPQGSFAVFGTPHSELTELKILDGKGNVLKQLTRDEIQNG